MAFKQTSLSGTCPTLTYRFAIQQLRNTHLVELLLISFHGEYRYGSAGKEDAGLIRGIIKTGVAVYDPTSIIIDFRDMEYTWGDNFDLSFEDAESSRVVVVVGDKCRKAMSTLAFGIDTKQDIVDNVLFFDDFDSALLKLDSIDR
ncbi:hypothetical protein LZZ85_00905 [Terrimonas sp. NA20]|uniref:STAS/SEC14 domain-containing protein n=1 Tax=Terrimonas ginsenosidimutans TaxID=2908004 RepID=A0ABS9KKM2_9BACT|nr:hypothetical protein [Terrimonas ginsenosidimutans]MCG2612810.1 hypothetical protein [Terrimonas ginsenosidimutans]